MSYWKERIERLRTEMKINPPHVHKPDTNGWCGCGEWIREINIPDAPKSLTQVMEEADPSYLTPQKMLMLLTQEGAAAWDNFNEEEKHNFRVFLEERRSAAHKANNGWFTWNYFNMLLHRWDKTGTPVVKENLEV